MKPNTTDDDGHNQDDPLIEGTPQQNSVFNPISGHACLRARSMVDGSNSTSAPLLPCEEMPEELIKFFGIMRCQNNDGRAATTHSIVNGSQVQISLDKAIDSVPSGAKEAPNIIRIGVVE
jgi:hypothetical protein